MIHALANIDFAHNESAQFRDYSENFKSIKTLVKTPHPWQKRFELITQERLVSVHAATGAGKSLAIMMSSHFWLDASPLNKVIIVVPQKAIGEEFGDEHFALTNGVVVDFIAPKNLCKEIEGSSKSHLKEFLQNTSTDKAFRVIVCCNPTLIQVYDENPELFQNIKLVVDETHHADTEEINGLGRVIKGVIGHNSILTMTATHFRTNGNDIIPAEYQDQFNQLNVPFYEVMNDCRVHTKAIQFNYAVGNKAFHKELRKVFDPALKTIIFIHRNESRRGLDTETRLEYKNDSVLATIQALGKIEGFNEATGCYYVDNGSHRLIVADLVTFGIAEKATAYVLKQKKDKTYKVDVIVVMAKFIEGSDFPPLQHCIIHGTKQAGEFVQMCGRVTRDWERKPFAKISVVLPKDLSCNDDMREKLNNHLKFIICAMSMINFFKPVHLRLKQTGGGSGGSESALDVIGDFDKQCEFRQQAILAFTNNMKDDDDHSYEHRVEVMNEVCLGLLAGL